MGLSGCALAVMVMVAIVMMMMVVMISIAVSVAIVIVVLGVSRRIVDIVVIILMVFVLELIFECQKGIITAGKERSLAFQQLPHFFLLPFLQVHTFLGVAATGGLALLHVICLLAFEVQELACMTAAHLGAWTTQTVRESKGTQDKQ